MATTPVAATLRYYQYRLSVPETKSTPSDPASEDLEDRFDVDSSVYSMAGWTVLVSQIKAGEETGIEQLHKLFSRSIRYYLCRQLGPQEIEDKVHDTFLIILSAIRRGDLGDPEHLRDFVRTVVRRQVAAYIAQAVHNRHEYSDLETAKTVADRKRDPEQEALDRQKRELMERCLSALPDREREILVRFYLKEQPEDQICREMELTETQFRLLKSRAKAKFGEVGKKDLEKSGTFSVLTKDRSDTMTTAQGTVEATSNLPGSAILEDPIVQILMSTAAAFQTVETGRSWLLTPSPSLGNVTPLSLIMTPQGREMVANELGLIEHGMF